LGWVEDNWFAVEPAPDSPVAPAAKPDVSAPAAHSHPGD
jgi:hypothetical protein